MATNSTSSRALSQAARPAGRFTAVPNPAQQTLRVARTTGEEASLLLQNMLGQVVLAVPLADRGFGLFRM